MVTTHQDQDNNQKMDAKNTINEKSPQEISQKFPILFILEVILQQINDHLDPLLNNKKGNQQIQETIVREIQE